MSDQASIDSKDYWAWRRQAVTLTSLVEWLRWQLEMDLGKYKVEKLHVPIQERIKIITERLDRRGACTHCCKSMYFCELDEGHKGKHTSEGLAWTTKDGFYP